ncbi:serine/threonineeeee-protein kinase [Sporothrix schenckii 1099-18]|uniref:Serine/threonine protein kinase n=2 Tax=Sporothrix schenckii TaxID=29908 RepID=U7PJF7_SPOS1|nr:serine/threonineeeee-protein kinase [Sporothrix schenckii 1099-18]ERS94869.1 serine/threonine protein kinase [Sporothrix schenckii ATCC 58251]KJR88985.1 serine/threonineeeee-protein kinase [Sporothrix schenckii 1099-18]
MGEAVTQSSSSALDTEEKTEPFPSSEYASRLLDMRVQESFAASGSAGNVHLDELVVPSDKDIRLLVRPLRSRSVSPGSSDNCEWVALRTEVASAGAADQPPETVLAVTQTSKDIKFTVLSERHSDGTPMPTLWCELYYDPSSDNQILLNRCDVPINLSRIYPAISPPASSDGTPSTPGTPTNANTTTTPMMVMPPGSQGFIQGIEYNINPGTIKALSPGTWRIKMGHTEVLDFRILERRRTLFKALPPPPLQNDTPASSGKRSFVADEDDDVGRPDTRRQKTIEGADMAPPVGGIDEVNKEAVIMFLRPTADPLVFPLPTSAKGNEVGQQLTDSHALLDMERQDTVVVPGSCDIDSYKLTKRDPIASTSLSTVFTGTMEHPEVPPGSVITVKVIKTRPAPLPSSPVTNTAAAAAAAALAAQQLRPQEMERVVVRQADTWLREYQSHEYLRHESIVRLYGGDARYLSLYMEHVDAKDLSKKGAWRASNSDYFTGDRRDALRILRDISGALHYIHGRNLVHNDVKPANILYSPERGAVLCDFGLSTDINSPPSAGGTPYYVPPEFIGRKLRGPPSDVWALGITMLYVLRKIGFPDTRGGRNRPKPLYWQIADVNKTTALSTTNGGGSSNATGTPSAAMQMNMWLSEIREAKDKLDRSETIERLTYEMLAPNPNQRITMKRVVSELMKVAA